MRIRLNEAPTVAEAGNIFEAVMISTLREIRPTVIVWSSPRRRGTALLGWLILTAEDLPDGLPEALNNDDTSAAQAAPRRLAAGRHQSRLRSSNASPKPR